MEKRTRGMLMLKRKELSFAEMTTLAIMDVYICRSFGVLLLVLEIQ
ncbi:hypothetical protein RchiOBHm_Chr6g0246571 [Rosa chinensis]|uniref:Uncharacterized protein n=1 Tax=Rosa chinensis TaxID=74649 RepID=A0A2P6PJJ8_ROSCH|nr:hypothetical protein RchiOBHm_Chr6g0246571 [Rosa chinensis]